MSQFVCDTHALHWHLTNDPRLSATASQLLKEADAGLHQIFVPSIVLVELIYLSEKGRLPMTLVNQLITLLSIPEGSYTVAPLNMATAQAMQVISRSTVPDMPDRIIVATAYQLNLPLISRDTKIQKVEMVSIIW